MEYILVSFFNSLNSPDLNATIVWHSGTLFRFTRWTQPASHAQINFGNGPTELSMLSVRSFSLSRKPLFALLQKAKAVHEHTQPQMITIRVLDQRGSWRKVTYRHRRKLSSVIMDESKRAALLKDAEEFLASETWYSKSGYRFKSSISISVTFSFLL